MSRTNWKGLERRVASDLGVERNSKRGLGESVADVIKSFKGFRIVVECKNRKSLNIDEGLTQAESYCSPDDIPVFIFKETGKKLTQVFMKLSYFKKLYRKLREKGLLHNDAVLQLQYKDFIRMIGDLDDTK